MFEVGIVGRFEAAHLLEGNFGRASRLHGHTYRVQVSISGERIAANGSLVDVGRLREALDRCLGELDYQCLNDLPAFQDRPSTMEAIAAEVHRQLAATVRQLGGGLLRVQVWESPLAFAAYQAEC